jgi:hypothetical protein
MIIECTSALAISPGNLGSLGPNKLHPKGILTAYGWSDFLPEIFSKLRIRSWQLATINTSILVHVGKKVKVTS